MLRNIISLLVVLGLSACAVTEDPLLLKYESETAAIEQQAARGEISQTESDNLKLQAQQEYQLARRREEERLFPDDESVSQQMKSQNQEISAVLRQVQ